MLGAWSVSYRLNMVTYFWPSDVVVFQNIFHHNISINFACVFSAILLFQHHSEFTREIGFLREGEYVAQN